MAEPRHPPTSPDPGYRLPGAGHAAAGGYLPGALIAFAAVTAGTAVLGAVAGLVWVALAPRALIVVAGRGLAAVVNPETSAFIVADGWFVLLTVVGGLLSGLLGYLLAVRRHGAVAMAAVLAGGLAAALTAEWIGQQPGAAGYDHSLVAGKAGALLHQPLMLGGQGLLAFWPLAAGLTAGGFEMAALIRRRSSERSRGPA